jgi:thiol-disulfide isomerase/thioredoxin
MHWSIVTAVLLVFFVFTVERDCSAMIGSYFGQDEITWKGYEEGLAQAKREGKPAIIVFYSESCSACKKYKEVLQDSSVVEASSPLIMIRVNTRHRPQLSAKYQFDGKYVPRTFAVFPDGRVMHHLYPSKRYKYFIGLEPDNLLSLVEKAREEMGR